VTLSLLLPLRTADKLLVRDRELAIENVDDDKRRIAGVPIALEIIARGSSSPDVSLCCRNLVDHGPAGALGTSL